MTLLSKKKQFSTYYYNLATICRLSLHQGVRSAHIITIQAVEKAAAMSFVREVVRGKPKLPSPGLPRFAGCVTDTV